MHIAICFIIAFVLVSKFPFLSNPDQLTLASMLSLLIASAPVEQRYILMHLF
jgi:hypothetical protein